MSRLSNINYVAIPDYAANCAWALTDFSLNNKALADQKDGQRQVPVLMSSVQRFKILNARVSKCVSSIKALGLERGISPCPYTILFFSLVEGYFTTHLSTVDLKNAPTLKTRVAKCIVKLDSVLKTVGQHSNKLMNVACFVSYTALIVLGFYPVGLIGLGGLLLSALKYNLLLPSFIDQRLNIILHLANLVTILTTPNHLLFQILDVALWCAEFESVIINDPLLSRFLPRWVSHPVHSTHHLNQNQIEQTIVKFFNNDLNRELRVNKDYVYSPHFVLLPGLEDKKFSKKDFKDLFEKLDKKIEEHSIQLDKSEKNGIDMIKSCLIHGHVQDRTPPNLSLFKKYMYLHVTSVLNNKANIEEEIKNLGELGTSCIEGWTREVSTLVLPQTGDINQCVHTELAKWRGAVINERLGELARKDVGLDIDLPGLDIDLPGLENGGGSNNIHVTNTVQAALYHRFRTYEGELKIQLEAKSILATVFKRYALPNANEETKASIDRQNALIRKMGKIIPIKKTIKANIESFMFRTSLNLEAGAFNKVILQDQKLLSKIEMDCNNPLKLIDVIYEACQPVDGYQKIGSAAIMAWMGDINKRLAKLIRNEDLELDYNLYLESVDGKQCLSKKGVQLLLLDKGIIGPSHIASNL